MMAQVSRSSSVLSTGSSVTATLKVTNASGSPVAGATVAFSVSDAALATLGSQSAVTDAEGIATVTLTAASATAVGNVALTASITSGALTTTATATFQVNSASTVEVLSSSTTASTTGDQVTVSAIVKAEGGVALSGAPVSFSTDTGTLQSASTATDGSGVATVKFTAGANKSNRTATVTVKSGSAVGSLSLPITGSKLSVAGATTVGYGKSTAVTVKAADANGNAISGAVVAVSSSLSNGLSSSSVTTDAQGQATLTYQALNSGTDKLTFSGLGATATASMIVSAVDFSFSTPVASTEIPVGVSTAVTVVYKNNGVGVSGKTVNFSSTGGSLTASSVTTGSDGSATVFISSTSAAPATIQASLTGGVTAVATLPVVFVATTPASVVLQLSPTSIGPNTSGSTANQAQLVAKVADSAGNPVSGMTVNFSRDTDLSGGNLLQATAITDSNGQATVQYASGQNSTATDGVVPGPGWRRAPRSRVPLH